MLVLGLSLTIGFGSMSGCKKEPEKTPEKKAAVTEGDKKLTLTVPGAAELKPGDTATIEVKIERTKFEDPVDVTISGLPEGVTTTAEGKIAKDATKHTFTLKADAAAKPGSADATVMAKGAGLETSQKVKVTVKAKAEVAPPQGELKLTPPGNAELKDGKGDVKIAITRKNFDEPVEISFKGPAGVTAKDVTIEKGKTDATLHLMAAKDAKDGEATVTAKSGTMTDTATFKVKIAKKGGGD